MHTIKSGSVVEGGDAAGRTLHSGPWPPPRRRVEVRGQVNRARREVQRQLRSAGPESHAYSQAAKEYRRLAARMKRERTKGALAVKLANASHSCLLASAATGMGPFASELHGPFFLAFSDSFTALPCFASLPSCFACMLACHPVCLLHLAFSPRRDGGARARALTPARCLPDEFPVSRASPFLSVGFGCNRDGPVCV
jgi:hypothetical protein